MHGPKLVDRPLPLFVQQLLFNNTEVETCLKVCIGNFTEYDETAEESTTQLAYIQGATAR
uniref:CCR4-NOT transcription complex subunit 11 n=1 Tax=Heterorhabditis bacteriophora TaxID=37862 RepID=A0A1I7WVM2_HETBA